MGRNINIGLSERLRWRLRQGCIAMATVWMAHAALAHTSIARTTPANGAILDASPPVIEISFREPAHLTSVVLSTADHAERALEFTPKSSAVSFRLDRPQLAAGRNEIRWKALSQDGHVISGTLLLTIKPSTATR